MANQKVSDLPSLNGADVDAADLLYIIDSSAGLAGSKKITIAQYQLAPYSGAAINGVPYFDSNKVLTSGASPAFDAATTTFSNGGVIESTSGGFKFPDGSTQTSAGVPLGTVMMFVQTAAPTGWTKSTTHNDKALRVVSGSVSSGGSVGFSTAFASQAVVGTVGATTLTTAQIPSHNHSGSASTASLTGFFQAGKPASASGIVSVNATGLSGGADGTQASATQYYVDASHSHTITVGSTGGGGSHDHTFTGSAINLAVQYVDVIIATKN
jgi:hypothetical protein